MKEFKLKLEMVGFNKEWNQRYYTHKFVNSDDDWLVSSPYQTLAANTRDSIRYNQLTRGEVPSSESHTNHIEAHQSILRENSVLQAQIQANEQLASSRRRVTRRTDLLPGLTAGPALMSFQNEGRIESGLGYNPIDSAILYNVRVEADVPSPSNNERASVLSSIVNYFRSENTEGDT